jgi:hypothetical protein
MRDPIREFYAEQLRRAVAGNKSSNNNLKSGTLRADERCNEIARQGDLLDRAIQPLARKRIKQILGV